MSSERQISLSAREMMYLRNATFLPATLAQLIGMAQHSADKDKYQLSISQHIAEQFRDAFTYQLAKAGFDEAYEPTSEGRMLEDLIDHFSVL
jgi:hypothetical protein